MKPKSRINEAADRLVIGFVGFVLVFLVFCALACWLGDTLRETRGAWAAGRTEARL